MRVSMHLPAGLDFVESEAILAHIFRERKTLFTPGEDNDYA